MAQNAAVVLVFHRLDEVRAIIDRITVPRDRRVGGRRDTAEADIAIIIRAMVGVLAEELPRAEAERQFAGTVVSLRAT